jgi:hypothetical protein
LFLACEQNAYTAYNPFEPDVIKVTNTATIDINVSPQAEFNNINTTPIFNTDSNVFTSIGFFVLQVLIWLM